MKRYIDVDKMINKYEEASKELYNALHRPNSWSDVYDCVIADLDEEPNVTVLEVPETGIGDVSDGYHTFNEPYHHRAILFSVICNMFPDKAWKSKLHDTGDMFEGMFIVGIETPEGQATYHYDIEPYWDMFKVKELDRAPIWDGHTPEDAINRISKLANKQATWRLETDEECPDFMFKLVACSECNQKVNDTYKFCPNCGAAMKGLTVEGCNGVKFK